MTIRDVQNDFAYQPPTATSKEICTGSIVGPAGVYLAPNSYDGSGIGGAYLTELTAMDQVLSVGGLNHFVENGAGFGMRLCVDWVTQPIGSGTIDTQLITNATPNLTHDVFNNPIPYTVMIDFGPLPFSAFVPGYRQIAALPRSSNWGRYLGVQITTTGTITQGGNYVAWLAMDLDSQIQGYADGWTIK